MIVAIQTSRIGRTAVAGAGRIKYQQMDIYVAERGTWKQLDLLLFDVCVYWTFRKSILVTTYVNLI